MYAIVLSLALMQNTYPLPLDECKNGRCYLPANAEYLDYNGVKWFYNGDKSYIYCYSPRKLVFDYRTKRWAAWNGATYDSWNMTPCPVNVPKSDDFEPIPAKVLPPIGDLPTGVDSEYQSTKTKFKINGADVSREKVFETIANNFDDISGMKRLTFIGTNADNEKAYKQLTDDIKKHFIVKMYSPDDWYVQKNGFVNNGKPTVYIQDHEGTVLHRQDDDKEMMTAINTAINYDPKNDPDLRKLNLFTGKGDLMTYCFYGVLIVCFVLMFPHIKRVLIALMASSNVNAAQDERLNRIEKMLQNQQADKQQTRKPKTKVIEYDDD